MRQDIYTKVLEEVPQVSGIDLAFISIILTVHKLSVPEVTLTIFREAAYIAIEYLKIKKVITSNELEKAINELSNCLKNPEKLNIVKNINVEYRDRNIVINVHECKFKNICRCVDTLITEKPEVLDILQVRPCAIMLLYTALIEKYNKTPIIKEIQCKNGNANIIITIT